MSSRFPNTRATNDSLPPGIPALAKGCLLSLLVLVVLFVAGLGLFFSLIWGGCGGGPSKAPKRYVEVPVVSEGRPSLAHSKDISSPRADSARDSSGPDGQSQVSGDSKKPNFSRSESTQIDQQARLIVGDLSEPRDQAYALFCWMAQNITYDVEGLLNPSQRPSQRAEDVLARRSGVCQGYSELFQALAVAVGLETQVVVGRVRRRSSEDMVGEDLGHAWNAVRIGERWLLLDSTWGAGYVNLEGREFRAELKPDWFDVPPEQLIYTHLPEDPTWQLLETPLTEAEFEEQLLARGPFFSLGLSLSEDLGPRFQVDKELSFRFKTDKEGRFFAYLLRGEGKVTTHPVQVWQDGRTARVVATFPEPGEYELVLTAGTPGQAPQRALTFWIQARQGGGRPLPKIWPAAESFGVSLLSPQTSGVEVDNLAEITLRTARPGRATAAIEFEGQRLKDYPVAVFQQDRDISFQTTFPGPGSYELLVFLREDEGQPGRPAVSYQFEVGQGGEPLPTLYQAFHRLGGRSFSPKRPLKAGQFERLEFLLPGASRVHAQVDGERIVFRRQDAVFEGSFVGSGSEVIVYASDQEDGSTEAIMKYLVLP